MKCMNRNRNRNRNRLGVRGAIGRGCEKGNYANVEISAADCGQGKPARELWCFVDDVCSLTGFIPRQTAS